VMQTAMFCPTLSKAIGSALVFGFLCQSQTLPNLPIQPLGPDDLISISVYDAPELSGAARVSHRGDITLPLMKTPIRAQGLVPAALETEIARALQREDLVVRPLVTVRILEYQSRPISVTGTVIKPVAFQAVGPVTLLDAINRAEGLSPLAGPDIVITNAGNGTLAPRRIRVADQMSGADPEANVTLRGGEDIRVPEAGKIFVLGNVRRPGAFPAGDASVLKAIALSEGLDSYAGRQAYIYRRGDGAGRAEIPVALKEILRRRSPDIALQTDDILYIPDNSGKRAGLAALEKILLFGSTAGATALIYRGAR
jgi:polysaccharide export outer membrane protein